MNSLLKFFSSITFTNLVILAFSSILSPTDAGTKFHSPADAFRQGLADYKNQDIKHAIPALYFAASKGVRQADLVLARIYMNGLGVKANKTKAFSFYRNYAYHFSKISFKHAFAPDAAEAFIALGKLYQSGIDGSSVRKDERAAFRHFYHAATQFRDPVAQYYVARIYLSGKGRSRNARMAANWLKRGYQKNHAVSQAHLGDLFWRGEGVEENKVVALALLKIAKINAFDRSCPGHDPASQRWIAKLLEKLDSSAEVSFREKAEKAVQTLYHSCNHQPTLESIERFFIRHNIIVRRYKEQPVEKLVKSLADSLTQLERGNKTLMKDPELGFDVKPD